MTPADRFQVPIPRAFLGDETQRKHYIRRARDIAASHGYRGRVRFDRQRVIGPPGGTLVYVQVLVRGPR